MTVTVRFAPSPTGYIHIGNARTALYNWLFASKANGQFILRFDDTDAERSRSEYSEAIAEDLHWLGLDPDLTVHQSQRAEIHARAARQLREAGLLYPCYETSEELERRRRILLSRRLPPVYGREALKLGELERQALEAEGRKPHWRFLLPNFRDDPFRPERTEITWEDLMRGRQTVDLASMSDPVLIRADGTFPYTLPSVADDIDLGVTHIIRGDDHVTNTGVQIAIFEALGAAAPVFGHHNLLTATSGEGLSKRSNALSLRGLREAGYEPMAVASLAVLIGTAEAVRAVPHLAALQELFDPAKISRSAAKFDPAELDVLNHELIQTLPFAAVADRLARIGIAGDKAEPFWLAVRENIARLDQAGFWWRIVSEAPAEEDCPLPEDREFIAAALELLPPEPWGASTWKQWTDAVKQRTGRSGKALYLPLRKALTGRRSGPELAALLPLMGRDRVLRGYGKR